MKLDARATWWTVAVLFVAVATVAACMPGVW